MNDFSFKIPLPKPRLRDTWTSLTWKERLTAFGAILWPEGPIEDKIFMWLHVLFYSAMMTMLTVASVWGISQLPFYTPTIIVVAGTTVYYMAIGMFNHIAGIFSRHSTSNEVQIMDQLLKETHKMIDDYSSRLLFDLRERSGRPDLNNDPISMAAATIEIQDSESIKIEDSRKPNPFRAVINNDMNALSDALHAAEDGDDDFLF